MFLQAKGHALFAPSGKNIVCSAVSALLRSFVRVLQAHKECKTEIDIKADGYLSVTINQCKQKKWLSGISEIILTGLIEIENDYPTECRLELIKGAENGT